MQSPLPRTTRSIFLVAALSLCTLPSMALAQTTSHLVVVKMVDKPNGQFGFEPNEVEAKRGDILRFTVGVGVHNVHFLPDSNAGIANLPAASDMLQLPDQTFDVPVNFAEGTYYFQCDPHAALGMTGHMKVED